MLRPYPYPALLVKLKPDHLSGVMVAVTRLCRNDPQVRPWQTRDIEDRLLASVAFALAFGGKRALRSKALSFWKWDSPLDFEREGHKIKLLAQRINEYGNSGPYLKFKMSRKVLDRSPAEVFLLAALDMPFVRFLGWIDRDGLLPHSCGRLVEIPVSSPHLRDLSALGWLVPQEDKVTRL